MMLVLGLAGGVHAPPASFAGDYLLFASQTQGTRGRVYDMDAEGNLTFRAEHEVGWCSNHISVSPDGRAAVFGSYWPPMGLPVLSVFFIGTDGSIAPPLYANNSLPQDTTHGIWNPIVFHGTRPLFYAGFDPISRYRYSPWQQTVEPLDVTFDAEYFWPHNMGYSAHAESLVYAPLEAGERITAVQTMKLDKDGSFGDRSTSSTLSSYSMRDLAVSRDGRWAAVSTFDDPILHLVRIGNDGTPTLMDEVSFPHNEHPDTTWLAFTPDSRHLLMLAHDGTRPLSQYEIDEAKGKLILRSWLEWDAPGWTIDTPRAVTVTPDGRYAAFCSVNLANLSHFLIHVVRIHKDGRLEYLPGKEAEVPYHLSDLAFAPLPEAGVEDWVMYE